MSYIAATQIRAKIPKDRQSLISAQLQDEDAVCIVQVPESLFVLLVSC